MAEFAQEPAPPEVTAALNVLEAVTKPLGKLPKPSEADGAPTEGIDKLTLGPPSAPAPLPKLDVPSVKAPDAGPSMPAAPVPVVPAVPSAPPTPPPPPPPPPLPELPDYALRHAPIFHLHHEEEYWPGDPLEHLANTVPHKKSGERILVSNDILGKCAMLDLPEVNCADTFLCLNDDPRDTARIGSLLARDGKPDAIGKSESTCWIIQVDKGQLIRPGIVDIFYFLFYPYNYGNAVVGTHFGNHVGDWEHVMIRFEHGEPIAIHLSAHANGHSYGWNTVERRGERPVVYIAQGSHAMYGKAGTHFYAGIPLVGPKDHTSSGLIWDPKYNYIAASYFLDTCTFSNLASPPGTCSSGLTPPQVLSVLNFSGRWGNSFSDIRNSSTPWYKKGKQELSILKWAEAPTGPKEKTLERRGMSWNTEELETRL